MRRRQAVTLTRDADGGWWASLAGERVWGPSKSMAEARLLLLLATR